MGYLINSGSGFLADAVQTVSSTKRYLIANYSSATLEIGVNDIGKRVYADGGYIESYDCSAADIAALKNLASPTVAANTLFASAIADGGELEAIQCFYDSYEELENIDIE